MESKLHFLDAIKLAGAFVIAYAVVQAFVTLKDVFLIFLTSVILALAADQVINKLEARQIPRVISAITIYLSGIIAVALMLYIIIPPLAVEVRNLLIDYPMYSEAILEVEEVERFDIMPYVRSLSFTITDNPAELLSAIFRTFGNFASFLAVFFIAFFLSVHRGGLEGFVRPLVPEQHKSKMSHILQKLREKVGSWLWGKTLSSITVGMATFLGLYFLGMPYALSLGVFALFLNFIPFIGPIIAAIPAVALGLTESLLLGLIVALYYVFVNGVFESFVLTPLFMRQAVEVNPALLILFVISGAYLGGILGIIIAIPLSAIIYVLVYEYRQTFLKKNVEKT